MGSHSKRLRDSGDCDWDWDWDWDLLSTVMQGMYAAHRKSALGLVVTYVKTRGVGPLGRSIGGGSPVHPGHHTIATRRRCGLLNAPSGCALSPLTGLRGGAPLSLLLAPDAGANNGR